MQKSVQKSVQKPVRRNRRSTRRLAVLVAGTFFMEILDGTILSTAAPDIARSLDVRGADIGIAITAYLVTLADCRSAS